MKSYGHTYFGQASMLETILDTPACFICGYPGAGKTTMVMRILSQSGGTVYKVTMSDCEESCHRAGFCLGHDDVRDIDGLLRAVETFDSVEDVYLVLDDAHCCTNLFSEESLHRLYEHRSRSLHVVLVASTLIDPLLECRVCALLPSSEDMMCDPADLEKSGEEDAIEYAWGWAAGAFAAGRAMPDDQRRRLLVADAWRVHVWDRLTDEQRRVFLACGLLLADNGVAAIDVIDPHRRTFMSRLPLVKVCGNRLEVHEAVAGVVADELAQLDETTRTSLHCMLGDAYRAQGDYCAAFSHYRLTDTIWNLLLVDPMDLLFAEVEGMPAYQCYVKAFEDADGDALGDNFAMMLRVVFFLLLNGEEKACWTIMRRLERYASEDWRRGEFELICFFLSLADDYEDALRSLARAHRLLNGCSQVLSLRDFRLCHIESVVRNFFMNGSSDVGVTRDVEETIGYLTDIWGDEGSASLMRSALAYYRCEFREAKILLHKSLLESKAAGNWGLQRDALAFLVGIDASQGGFSKAERMLDSLDAIPITADRRFDERAHDVVCAKLYVSTNGFDDIADWIKNGDVETGRNVVAWAWEETYLLHVKYLTKIRRDLKALACIEFLLDHMSVRRECPVYGEILVLEASNYLDIDDEPRAIELIDEAYRIECPYRFFLPFIEMSKSSERYRACLKKSFPQIEEIIERNEEEIERQHAFHMSMHERLRGGVFALLTERECEVAMLVAQGYRNKEIAAKLYITERTVKQHLTTIYHKLGVKNRQALAEKLEIESLSE